MNTLFLFFNNDGTIRTAALRQELKKVPDFDVWEGWEMYQVLTELGYEPIVTESPNGPIHMIVF